MDDDPKFTKPSELRLCPSSPNPSDNFIRILSSFWGTSIWYLAYRASTGESI